MAEMSANELFAKCGVPTNRRNVMVLCPKCGGGKTKEKSCSIDIRKGLGRCWRASCNWRFNAKTFYEEVTGEKLAGNFVAEEVPEQEVASIERRDTFYKTLYKRRGLSQKHKDNLRQRGLENYVPPFYFSSGWDYKEAMALAEFLPDGEGIPGAFLCKTGKPTLKQTKPGIAMPFLDMEGRIQGIHIRKDNDVLDEGELKCAYFSSKGKNGGTSATAWLHWSVDRDENNMPIIPKGEIFLTEGIMKADIAHHLSNSPFIAIPGVKCTTTIESLLKSGVLRDLGVHTVSLCLDMDRLDTPTKKANEDVKKANDTFFEMFSRYGYKCIPRKWDVNYKGIDDYLAFRNK